MRSAPHRSRHTLHELFYGCFTSDAGRSSDVGRALPAASGVARPTQTKTVRPEPGTGGRGGIGLPLPTGEGWGGGEFGDGRRYRAHLCATKTAGGCPAASYLSCLAKKGNPKKAPPVCRPPPGVPCVARLVRRLRNSRYALKQSSPTPPDQPALLGGAQGNEEKVLCALRARFLFCSQRSLCYAGW